MSTSISEIMATTASSATVSIISIEAIDSIIKECQVYYTALEPNARIVFQTNVIRSMFEQLQDTTGIILTDPKTCELFRLMVTEYVRADRTREGMDVAEIKLRDHIGDRDINDKIDEFINS